MAFGWFKKKPKAQEPEKHPEDKPEPAGPQDLPVQEPSGLPEIHPAAETGAAEDQPAPAPAPAEVPPIETAAAFAEVSDKGPKKGFFQRLKNGLSKTRKILNTDIEDLFRGGRKVDDDLLEELEELLITSDIGVQTTMDLMASITGNKSRITDAQGLKEALKTEILGVMQGLGTAAPPVPERPHVVMVVGVNGVGKTTTIGKLAARDVRAGKTVLIAAADTFRAAAIEQLSIWAERAGAEIVKHKHGSDPAAVAFDGLEAAMARGIDTVYIDTAGRLHTKVNLMEELKKIKRTVSRKMPAAPHEILLVLDATTGQNALAQAKLFNEAMDLTGIALTKLDGTAKGGIVVGICREIDIPLQYVGVGERIEDLQPFDARQFVEALF